MVSLAGCRALVTGTPTGVGLALARRLAKEGARLALVGPDPTTLEHVVTSLASTTGCMVVGYRADLTSETDTQALYSCIERDFDQLDLLIHADDTTAALDLPAAEEIDVDDRPVALAPYLLARRLLPLLRAPQGQVMFVTFTRRSIADAIRIEVNREGVRMISVMLDHAGAMAPPDPPDGDRRRPRQRTIPPDDLASLLLTVLMMPQGTEVTDVSVRAMSLI